MRLYLIFDDRKKQYVYVDLNGQDLNFDNTEKPEVVLITKQMKHFGLLTVEQISLDKNMVILKDSVGSIFCSANGNLPMQVKVSGGKTMLLNTSLLGKFKASECSYTVSENNLPYSLSVQLSEGMVQRLVESWGKDNELKIRKSKNIINCVKMPSVYEEEKKQISSIRVSTHMALNRDIRVRKDNPGVREELTIIQNRLNVKPMAQPTVKFGFETCQIPTQLCFNKLDEEVLNIALKSPDRGDSITMGKYGTSEAKIPTELGILGNDCLLPDNYSQDPLKPWELSRSQYLSKPTVQQYDEFNAQQVINKSIISECRQSSILDEDNFPLNDLINALMCLDEPQVVQKTESKPTEPSRDTCKKSTTSNNKSFCGMRK